VFAAVDDVAGKSSEAERESAAEEQKSTDNDEEAAKVEESAPEFAERIHKSIIEEGTTVHDGDWLSTEAGGSLRLLIE
jgi:hypothetical protein